MMMKFKLKEKKKVGLLEEHTLKKVVVTAHGDGEYVDEVRKLLEASDKWVLI